MMTTINDEREPQEVPTTARRYPCTCNLYVVATVAGAQHPHGGVRQHMHSPYNIYMFVLSQKHPAAI